MKGDGLAEFVGILCMANERLYNSLHAHAPCSIPPANGACMLNIFAELPTHCLVLMFLH